jgi:hypothetical protein
LSPVIDHENNLNAYSCFIKYIKGKREKKMSTISNCSLVRFKWLLITALLLSMGVSGCSTISSYIPFIGKKKPQEAFVKKLWTSGEQFVAIEKQDRQQGIAVKPNQHLSDISVDRVRTMLESMELRPSGSDKLTPVFNEEEIKVLSEYIPVGLALAGPDEDVTFALIGHYVEAMGFLKKREVTTGRVFYQDGRINIIFGDIHRELKETMGVKEDRRLFPFLPGSRSGSVGVQDCTILPKQGGEIFAKNRQDWVAFQLNSAEGQSIEPVAQEAGEEPPVVTQNTGTLSPGAKINEPSPAPQYAAPPAAPKYSPTAAAPRYTAAPAVPQYTGSAVRENRQYTQGGYQAAQPAAKKSIEERLTILNNLRNKRLITEQEYRDKRMEILGEL